MMKSYEIGEKKYVQRAVVMGQFDMLLPILTGIPLREGIDVMEIVAALQGKIPDAMAIVLVEPNLSIQDAMEPENFAARVKHLTWNMDPEKVVEVVTDFFECNPISSISSKIKARMGSLQEKLSPVQTEEK